VTLLYDEDPWPATITEIDPAQGLLTVRFEDGSLEPNVRADDPDLTLAVSASRICALALLPFQFGMRVEI
jgi:hypothetical protein